MIEAVQIHILLSLKRLFSISPLSNNYLSTLQTSFCVERDLDLFHTLSIRIYSITTLNLACKLPYRWRMVFVSVQPCPIKWLFCDIMRA